MRYVVHRPGPPFGAFVEYLWSLHDTPRHTRERILPSGAGELVIDVSGSGESSRRLQGAVVSGCFSAAFDVPSAVHVGGLVGVHFRPGGAARLLGVPAGEIADRHVGLEDLWGRRAGELRERLCATASPGQRFGLLEQAMLAGLREAREKRNAVSVALAELDRPGVEIGDVAGKVGLSWRRLIEVFRREVGLTPKHYAKVRRFQRALALATGKTVSGSVATSGGASGRAAPSGAAMGWARLALESGYFDQAHLCRDWNAFTGLSPTELVALRATPVKDNHVALPESPAPPGTDSAGGVGSPIQAS